MLELLLHISSISNWHLTFRRQLLLTACSLCRSWIHFILSVSTELYRTKGIILNNVCLSHFPWKFIYRTGNGNIKSFYQSLIIILVLLPSFYSQLSHCVYQYEWYRSLITITIQCGHNALCSKSNLDFDFRKSRWSLPRARSSVILPLYVCQAENTRLHFNDCFSATLFTALLIFQQGLTLQIFPDVWCLGVLIWIELPHSSPQYCIQTQYKLSTLNKLSRNNTSWQIILVWR